MDDEIQSVDSLEINTNNSIHHNASDSHFIDLLNEKLNEIQTHISVDRENTFIHRSNNSPISLSNSNSDSDGSSNYDNDSHYQIDDLNYRKLSYYQVERSIEKYYEAESSPSNELDVLITYMKGQKNLYIQSKNVTQYKLNLLFIPALLITTSITIFAPFIQAFTWGGGFIAGLNAVTALLISLSNYLKLESSVEMFYNTANQYDKLETSLEFVSSKLLFIENESDKSKLILKQIQDVEKKIEEIKQWNSLFIPQEVRDLFPIICNINVFSFIKRIESKRKSLVMKLKDVKNEIRYISHIRKLRLHGIKSNISESDPREISRLKLLEDVKDKVKEELLNYRSIYANIDKIFTKEIRESNLSSWFPFFGKKNTNDQLHKISSFSDLPLISNTMVNHIPI